MYGESPQKCTVKLNYGKVGREKHKYKISIVSLPWFRFSLLLISASVSCTNPDL